MSDPRELSLTWTSPQPDVAYVTLAGDLDYDSADALATAVNGMLESDSVRELRLDCAGVQYCDSYGLSTLLMVRRRTAEAGIALHLDNRGPALDRLLRVTNTLEHLTGRGARAREEQFDS
ncbi:STAS domain-containing protein [Pseudonocardia nematodicida]|uniref:STAS domain-containing protein n=1 Tax=Pseudonocardia nematodicida TaxID=1206997 RepID=A0ABV1KAK0_9PSEU